MRELSLAPSMALLMIWNQAYKYSPECSSIDGGDFGKASIKRYGKKNVPFQYLCVKTMDGIGVGPILSMLLWAWVVRRGLSLIKHGGLISKLKRNKKKSEQNIQLSTTKINMTARFWHKVMNHACHLEHSCDQVKLTS